jgi:hypothetical protein
MEFVERVDQRRDRGADSASKLKVFAGLVALTFAVTLALVVGNRLTNEALAVLAGAVCGVGAAIPTSLIIVAISRRQREEIHDEPLAYQPGAYPQGTYPPVVIVTPQSGQHQQPYGWNGIPPSLSTQSQREFTVVGGAPMTKEVGENGRYF